LKFQDLQSLRFQKLWTLFYNRWLNEELIFLWTNSVCLYRNLHFD
jgi:hypothetical protein